jgi:Ca2+-binding EF-hand superfamily protein
VAVFSCLDNTNYGYLDFENIKNFLLKFKKEILKEHINAILRRLSDQPDGKITFREFSLCITPNPTISFSDEAAATVIDETKKQ